MTIVEHLTELRKRLVISIASVGVGAIVGWFLYGPVYDLLTGPFCETIEALPRRAQPPTGCALVISEPTAAFLIKIKVVIFTGLGLALPIVAYQLWRFITPGLTSRERKLAVPFVLVSVLLFALGAFFAYWTLPRGLSFLLGFAGDQVVPLLHVDKYIGFIMVLTLVFGLSFEFPLVLIFLALIGLVNAARLRTWRRNFYVGLIVFAAVATPSQDPWTLLIMWVPLVLFYELTILVVRTFRR